MRDDELDSVIEELNKYGYKVSCNDNQLDSLLMLMLQLARKLDAIERCDL